MRKPIGYVLLADMRGSKSTVTQARAGLRNHDLPDGYLRTPTHHGALLDAMRAHGDIEQTESDRAGTRYSLRVIMADEDTGEYTEEIHRVTYRKRDGAVGCTDVELLKALRAATVRGRRTMTGALLLETARRLIRTEADCLPLVRGGSAYFVPMAGRPILRKVCAWVEGLPGEASLSRVVVWNHPSLRGVVWGGFARYAREELRAFYNALRRYEEPILLGRRVVRNAGHTIDSLHGKAERYEKLTRADAGAVRAELKQAEEYLAGLLRVRRRKRPEPEPEDDGELFDGSEIAFAAGEGTPDE